MVMFIGQLSGRKSLRDLVMNVAAQTNNTWRPGHAQERRLPTASMVEYRDPETGKELRFVTNASHLEAKTIAELYKECWQIELFFKWIKGNLKIKTFLGTSQNAVLTQIWIALCTYLFLAFLKFKVKLGVSMQQMLRLLQLNLFERRNLIELFKPPDTQHIDCRKFLLFHNL